jgi:uncharacterized protein YeaO (DUF488 family)
MKKLSKLRTFQIGVPPKRGEGLRIGTTRRPPRGVPRNRWQRDGYFDLWFPIVAPSAQLLDRTKDKDFDDPAVQRRFFEAYRRELSRPPARHGVALLAALARRIPIAIGCFCADESRCHRSVLRQEIMRRA